MGPILQCPYRMLCPRQYDPTLHNVACSSYGPLDNIVAYCEVQKVKCTFIQYGLYSQQTFSAPGPFERCPRRIGTWCLLLWLCGHVASYSQNPGRIQRVVPPILESNCYRVDYRTRGFWIRPQGWLFWRETQQQRGTPLKFHAWCW